ncbi:hypothetical protein FH972_001823 [Carpinus fangiana]|uniref:Uncharacterized protein n=1 Tax=Carpinus fangiana TaxID=176857 RepID=A0A5N6QDB3_9ROSI|nr:hypothetical protein FH972_001823 [Carpinus fangiana]
MGLEGIQIGATKSLRVSTCSDGSREVSRQEPPIEIFRICACPNESREMFGREPSRSLSLKLCPDIVFICPVELDNGFANLRRVRTRQLGASGEHVPP